MKEDCVATFIVNTFKGPIVAKIDTVLIFSVGVKLVGKNQFLTLTPTEKIEAVIVSHPILF